MSIKLQKEQIRFTEVVCSKYCQTTVESDIIVPDIKPDILKILQADSSVVITQKSVQNEKVFVQGTVKTCIIYIPDNGISGSVKSINTVQEFNHTMDIKEARLDMEVCIDAECEPTEYTLVNSRKLSVRSKIGICIRLLGTSEMAVATGIDEDSQRIEAYYSNMNLYNPCIDASRDIIVRERIEVAAGKPDICEVIKVSAVANSTELRLATNKAVVKGELKICTLYCGEGDSIVPEVMEHTLPFSEILEIDGLREDMNGEIDYKIKNLYFEICQDNDGDKRVLGCEITLEAVLRAFETISCSVIEDAYGIDSDIELKKKAVKMDHFLGSCTEKLAIKEAVAIPDYLPEIHRLCECNGATTVESVSIENNTIIVRGFVSCNFLYLSQDTSTPASGFVHILPFSQSFDMEGLTADSICDAKAEIDHISCIISGGKLLEVRAVVSISIKVTKPYSAQLVEELNVSDAKEFKKAPSMAIYFVQNGDTLWSIAKKYHISPKVITDINGTEAEIMKPGRCIYIFR